MQREDEYREPNVRPGENIDDLTDKIILAVLDCLDINSPISTDGKTKGPLTSILKKLKKTKENTQPLSNELRTDAARTVSRLLLSSTEAWEITRSSSSFPSSLASEPDLDSMFKAMAQSGFPTGVMRSLLDSTAHDIIQTIEYNKNLSSYRKFITGRMTKTINEKVKVSLAVCKELVRTEATELEQDGEPPSSSHTSQMDDLTIMCTHDVIDEIIQVCHAHGGGEQGVQEVMQELESIVSSCRSSSKNGLRVIDLEEHHKSLLSDEFHQKVKRAISDALLRTTGALSAQLHTTTDDIVVEDLEMCAEQSATYLESSPLIESAASDMAETIIEDLKKVSSQQVDDGSVTQPEPSRKTFHSAARRLYRNVHFKVFGFLSRLQESHSSPPPHIIPRYNTCSCMDEVCFNLVEKSEPLLSSSSYGREFSSPAQTTSAAAVERNLESRKSAGATLNGSCETLNQTQGVKTDPATAKKRILRIRKRLARIFSSIRRALLHPFQCMSNIVSNYEFYIITAYNNRHLLTRLPWLLWQCKL